MSTKSSSLRKLLHLLDSSLNSRDAFQIHAQIITDGFSQHPFALRKLVSFFALSGSGDIDYALLIFAQIDRPGIFFWNTLIRAYSRLPTHQNSVFLYKQMLRSATLSNNYTFPFLINSCARFLTPECGRQVHSHIVRNGFESDLFIANSLMHMYSVFGDMDSARQVFDGTPRRDVVSYNTIITGYSRVDKPRDASFVFREMQIAGIVPDEYTIVGMLSTCTKLGDMRLGKHIHLLICKNSEIDENLILESALVDMYAKLGSMESANLLFCRMRKKSPMSWSSMVSGYAKNGEIGKARLLFDSMPDRDPVTWTAMISGYSQAGYFQEALQLFEEMENEGLELDEVSLVCVLSVCAGFGALNIGKKLHSYVNDRLVEQNPVLATALVDMYAKCGCIDAALDVFHGVVNNKKGVSLFNAMISGLAQHGQGYKALELLIDMEGAGLRPDGITYVSILSACSHTGLIAEGRKQFYSMIKNHGIVPQIEHCTCMVDLLGRAGFVKEANAFIKSMPVSASPVAWRALLGACEVHGDVEIGELVGTQLLELDPHHGGRYILLSNMFSKANRWDDARKMRELMSEKGIQKPPGWSLIELHGILHQFLVNDKSHPNSDDIHLMLENLWKNLKSAGSVIAVEHIMDDM